MTMRCGLKNIMLRPSEIMRPQDGVGGGTPSPRNDSAASIAISDRHLERATTMIWSATLGRISLSKMRRCEAPTASAAMTNSCWRNCWVTVRVTTA